jgi:hypothetical protein
LTSRSVRSVVDDTADLNLRSKMNKSSTKPVQLERGNLHHVCLTACDYAKLFFLMNLVPLDEAQVLCKSQLHCRFLAPYASGIRERRNARRLKNRSGGQLAFALLAKAKGFCIHGFPLHRTCEYWSVCLANVVIRVTIPST